MISANDVLTKGAWYLSGFRKLKSPTQPINCNSEDVPPNTPKKLKTRELHRAEFA